MVCPLTPRLDLSSLKPCLNFPPQQRTADNSKYKNKRKIRRLLKFLFVEDVCKIISSTKLCMKLVFTEFAIAYKLRV